MEQQANGSRATSATSDRAIHGVAVGAVVVVGLALVLVGPASRRTAAHDAREQAAPITTLPYEDEVASVSSAGLEPDEPQPSCGPFDHTVWYAVDLADDTPLSIRVAPASRAGPPLDVALAAWTAAPDGTLTESGCVDERDPDLPEQLVFGVEGDGATFLQVGTPSGAETRDGTLTVLVDAQRPEHDVFAFARRVGTAPFHDPGVDAIDARREPGEPVASCADLAATTWYRVTAPADGTLTAVVAPAEGGDPAMDVGVAVYEGEALDSLREVACVDAAGPRGLELVETRLVGGRQYAIQVGAVLGAETAPGPFSVTIKGRQELRLAPVPDTVYGAAPLELTAGASSGLPVALAAEGPCAIEGTTLRTSGAGTCTISATQAGDADWAPAEPVRVELAIARAPQTVRLEPIEGARVGEPLRVAASASSGLPVRLEAHGACLARDGLVSPLGAGTCTISATQAGDADWAPAEPVRVEVRIGRGRQAIAFEPLPDTVYGAAPLELAASASSGLPVAFAAEGPCRVEGDALVLEGAGTCAVDATQAGDVDWEPAAPVRVELAIARAPQELSLAPIPNAVLGAEPMDLRGDSTSGLPLAFESEGPCAVEGSSVRFTGAGICAVRATQAGDEDWAPAPPVRRAFRIDRAQQVITFAAVGSRLLGEPPIRLVGEASSGLPVAFVAYGPCTVDGDLLTLVGSGDCTVTAYQVGDTDWAAAREVAQSFRIEAPITERMADFAGRAATTPPGTLVGSGALITSAIDPARGTEEYYAVALAPGDVLEVELAEGSVGTDILGPGGGAWSGLSVEAATGLARWVAREGGIHTVRVRDTGSTTEPPHAYIIGFRVLAEEPDPEDLRAREGIEAALIAGAWPMECDPAREPADGVAGAEGALAGIACDAPTRGLASYALTVFPDTASTGSAFERRVAAVTPVLERRDDACRDGAPGVAAWEHGEVACWVPPDGRAQVHWTDERTDTYGILEAAGTNIKAVHRRWLGRPDGSGEGTAPGSSDPQVQAAAVLRARAWPVDCETRSGGEETRPFREGALAMIVCPEPAGGLASYAMISFPDAGTMVGYFQGRVSEVRPVLERRDDACRDGAPGVAAWEHGEVACWVPPDGRAQVHWTDERTDTYGILEAAGTNIKAVHRRWLGRPDGSGEGTAPVATE